jgi:hypothetical protein
VSLTHRLAVAAPVLAAGAIAACDGNGSQPSAGEVGPPPAETVRDCRSAVYGKLAPRTRKASVTAGPLALLVADGGGRAAYEPSGVVKVLALVRSGETVTLAVPEAERRRLSLLYDLGRGPRRPLRLSDGTSAARFEPCAKSERWAAGKPYPDAHETQFNGGLYVRGAHCASLDVWVEERSDPLALALALGVGDRPCPP